MKIDITRRFCRTLILTILNTWGIEDDLSNISEVIQEIRKEERVARQLDKMTPGGPCDNSKRTIGE